MENKLGYIALLDVLGFSDNMIRADYRNYLKSYKDAVTAAISEKVDLDDETLEPLVFSDTILINTINDSKKSFKSILKACSRLFYLLLKKRIAIRGCIAFGDFNKEKLETSERNMIVAGPPIIEAYSYEKKQNWVGIMLAPSVVSKQELSLNNLTAAFDVNPISKYIQRNMKIPFHDGEYDGYSILPSSPDSNTDFNEIGFEVCSMLDNLKLCSSDSKIQFKYQATKEWINEVFKLSNETIQKRKSISNNRL
jgi:hypothetical protein